MKRTNCNPLAQPAAIAFAILLGTPSSLHAREESGVDVTVHDTAVRRIATVELNPLAMATIGKWGANVVLVPVEHHALVVSPFYSWTKTVPIAVFDDAGNGTAFPQQTFSGFGTELGYRYYAGNAGPRGFFVGPSVLVASFEATAQDGSTTPFVDLGLAADGGYQALVADRLALSLGGGIQYVWTSKEVGPVQFPSRTYASRGFAPRVLLSIGWAL
jgi:hypothetical protein